MRHVVLVQLALLAAALPAQANTFLLTGALADGTAPADGVFTIELRLIDENGDALWQETQPGVVVVDGGLALDVGAAEPLPPTLPAGVRLVVTIEGDELAPLPLAVIVRAARAARADAADAADSVDVLAGVTSSTAARRSALATPGAAAVSFANLTGVPASVLDGDDGTVIAGGADGVAFTASTGLLEVDSVQGSAFRVGTFDADRFVDGSIDSSRIAAGAITGAKVNNDLTRSDMASGFQLRANKALSTPLFVVVATAAAVPLGTLMTTATCAADTCIIPGPQFDRVGRVACNDANSCSPINPSTCANTAVGSVVTP